MLTDSECLEQGRCPEHQSLRADLCPWKHQRKYGVKMKKKEINPAKHDCSEHTTSKISKDWISFSCSCGLRWGGPYA